MTKTNFKAKGMHCTSCEALVKDALHELKGVNSVEASHKSGTISVDFNSEKTTEKEIQKTIESEGYKVI